MSRRSSLGGLARRSRPFSYRPLVEALEGRWLPSFLPSVSYPVDSYPRAVAVGDFNGDGSPDLAATNYSNNGTVGVLLGNGDGSFQAAQSYAAGANAVSVAVGDFDGD